MAAPQDDYKAPEPGRVQKELFNVKKEWVLDIRGSTTRADLWKRFENYLGRFAQIEYYALKEGWIDQGESLINYMWLGGSFISDKLDPENIDVTVFLNGTVMKKLRGKRGCGWINNEAFSRRSLLKSSEFSGITPLRVDYYPVKSVFQLRKVSKEELEYLTYRGAWDDWWQRLRDKGCSAPTESSAVSRRGYVEVIL